MQKEGGSTPEADGVNVGMSKVTAQPNTRVVVPPGYKQTKVGVIPEDWSHESVRDLASITTGKRNTQDKVDDGTYPFFVRSSIVERINSYSFDGEAVLTAGDGVGTGKVFHYIDGKFDFHQRVYKISDFRSDFDGYFFYLYFSNKFYNRIMSMTAKSSVDSVRLEVITDMQIPHPPLPEQRAIAAVLSDVDGVIGALDKLIAKKRAIKLATTQQLLTGKTRLPGFSGEWKNKRLGSLGYTYGGLTGKTKQDFGNGSAQYITFLNIINNVVIDSEQFDKVRILPSERQNRVSRGDLFFNGSSETPEEVGMCAVLLADVHNVFLNSFCFGFRLYDEDQADGLYLAYFFRSNKGRELLYSLAQGATRYNLSKTNFLKLDFQIPRIEEQRTIAAMLSDMDHEIVTLERQREKTRDIKQGMIQALLTGRVRLVNQEASA